MTENELISQIKTLRKIQPRQDWVVFTRNSILGQEEGQKKIFENRLSIFEIFQTVFFQPKFAISAVLALFILLGGLYIPVKNSLPGESLYLAKKAYEKTRQVFAPKSDLTEMQIKFANNRLEELTEIVRTNQVSKIASGREEYQNTMAAVAKSIKKAATTSDSSAIKKIAAEIQKLEENKEKLAKNYGIGGLDVQEQFNPAKMIADWLIKDLEKRTLTEEQSLILVAAKSDFEEGLYNSSLEKILSFND